MAPAPTQRPSGALIAAALAASLYAWAVCLLTPWLPGKLGLNYNALGTDFMVFHAAIQAALQGDISLLSDGDRFTAALNAKYAHILSASLPFRPWVYPPLFLILLLPFGLLPFYPSFALFQLTGMAVLAAALCAGKNPPRGAKWVALAALICPAASICVVDGQGSFLVAGLMVAGMRLLSARPGLGGLLWGLLSFKPQFALLLPAALTGGKPRAWLAAGLSAITLAGLSATIFGLDVWHGWLAQTAASNAGTDPRWLLYGRIWGHSVFTCALLLGAPSWAASTLQLVALAGALAAVAYGMRSLAEPGQRAALLLAASLIAAPHWGSYDGVLLMAATALFLADDPRGRPAGAWLLGFCVWMMPLLGPPALNDLARLGPLLTMAVIGAILRGRRDWAHGVEL